MKKFRRFLGRISAKTCLKIDYLMVNPKNVKCWGLRLQTPFRFSDLRMCNNPTPIEHFWLMHMLGNFRAKRNLYFKFSAPPFSLSKDRSSATKRGWRLSTLQTNPTFKKMENCSQHNVLHYECYQCQTKKFYPCYLLSFSKFSYRQNMFWSSNLSLNMPESTSFLLKNRKNRPSLGTLSPDPICLLRLGGTPPY